MWAQRLRPALVYSVYVYVMAADIVTTPGGKCPRAGESPGGNCPRGMSDTTEMRRCITLASLSWQIHVQSIILHT